MSKGEIYKNFGKNGRRRHAMQAMLLFLFLLFPQPLPFEGLERGILKFDFNEWRIYFFGIILVPGLFHLFYLSFVIPLFALAVVSSLYSKVFCGWVCPQNVFYELFDGLNKALTKRFPAFRKSKRLQSSFDLFLSLFFGVIVTYTVLSYFEGANQVFLGAIGTFVFLFFVFDTHWLKHDFCKNACPYAYIQKVFQAPNSLHVVWEDRPNNKCGVCRACETACYVDINVRKDPFNIDCTMCGACVDACDRVYSRRPEPSLLKFGYVPHGEEEKGFAGLNTLPKVFVVLSFSLFCLFFLYQVLARPMETFRVDYPASGSSEQLPFVDSGKTTNRLTLRVRSLVDRSLEYEVIVGDSDFKLVWKESGVDGVIRTEGLKKFDTPVWLQYEGGQLEKGEYRIVPLSLKRISDGKIVGSQEIFFKG